MSKIVIGAVPNNIKQILCDYISNLKCKDPEQSVNLWCPLFLDNLCLKKQTKKKSDVSFSLLIF